MSRRFQDRPKRIARRTEREKFDRMVMPAAFICLPVAVAILIAAALSYLVYGTFPREVFVLGVAVLAIGGVEGVSSGTRAPQQGAGRTVSGPVRDKKRRHLARLAIWMGILGGAVLFWLGAGALLVAWLRVSF